MEFCGLLLGSSLLYIHVLLVGSLWHLYFLLGTFISLQVYWCSVLYLSIYFPVLQIC